MGYARTREEAFQLKDGHYSQPDIYSDGIVGFNGGDKFYRFFLTTLRRPNYP